MTRHRMWRHVSGGVIALSSVLATCVLAAPARADVLDPGVLDPVVEILPPRPAPYVPYTGDICRTGSNTCIDKTIAQMRTRLAPLARSCSHSAVFSLAYLRVTEDVRRALRSGFFDDPVWLNQVDAIFARMYFKTMDDWKAGRRAQVPTAWRIALKAEDDRAMTGIGNFMLAMNAHINRDFPNVIAQVGLTARNGTSHKPDHNAYNPRLDALYAPVFAEMAARFDPTFDDLDAGPFDEAFVGGVMRGWREAVWRHAENIVLARTPLERALARQEVEAYAASQAALIRTTFASPSPSARDAWCAQHHG
jgi:Family of unknown function (DUF5995)